MKKYLDKSKQFFKSNRNYILFLSVLAVIGITFGALFAVMIKTADRELVKTSLESFLTMLRDQKLSYLNGLKDTSIANLVYVVSIWLLGISVIGIPIILFLFFSKAFMIGFSIASIILNYHWKGILLSFVYVFPHHILNLLTSMVLLIFALSLSLRLFQAIVKRKAIDFKPIMNKYSLVLGIVIGVFMITSLLETFVMPNIVKLILPLFI